MQDAKIKPAIVTELAPVRGESTPTEFPVQQHAPASGAKSPARGALKKALLVGIVGVGVAFLAYKGYDYYVAGRFLVSTDDAYVKADTSVMAAKVAGYVVAVPFEENMHVRAGDVLARIDPTDYKLAVTAAQDRLATQDAAIARIGKQMEAQNSAVAQALAQLASAQAEQDRALAAFQRTSALAQNGSSSQAALDQARADRDRAVAAVAGAKAAVDSANAALGVIGAQRAEATAQRAELETALAKAERDLASTEVRAPFDGVVGNRAAQPGQYVQPGARLMALVPLDQVYIEANFKETQLAGLKAGQKVDVEIDALKGRSVEGVVQGIAPASGAEFSLLPPENATGNFTKIVQRVPVRIKLDPALAREGVLRPGLSVVATVHTRDDKAAKPSLLSLFGFSESAAAGQVAR